VEELAERAAALPREWQQSILQSTQYAHYTSENIIRSIWSAIDRLGFTGGKVLEPGAGIGSFAMLMPESMRRPKGYTGIEFDAPTALIARLLSPQQNLLHDDFIKRKLPRDFFDVAVGNPPFSATKVLGDPDYAKHGFMLHDFFFAKALDRVRPGGLLVFVTSKGTMDKQSDKARAYLAKQADLLGAIRLPSTAFEGNAGTSVVTDVLFLRKRLPGEAPAGHSWNGVARSTPRTDPSSSTNTSPPTRLWCWVRTASADTRTTRGAGSIPMASVARNTPLCPTTRRPRNWTPSSPRRWRACLAMPTPR